MVIHLVGIHFSRSEKLLIGLFRLIFDTVTYSMALWANQQDTTFWGQIYMTYFALPHLRRTGGKILVIASAASWLPYPREIIYNVSHAFLIYPVSAIYIRFVIKLYTSVRFFFSKVLDYTCFLFLANPA